MQVLDAAIDYRISRGRRARDATGWAGGNYFLQSGSGLDFDGEFVLQDHGRKLPGVTLSSIRRDRLSGRGLRLDENNRPLRPPHQRLFAPTRLAESRAEGEGPFTRMLARSQVGADHTRVYNSLYSKAHSVRDSWPPKDPSAAGLIPSRRGMLLRPSSSGSGTSTALSGWRAKS